MGRSPTKRRRRAFEALTGSTLEFSVTPPGRRRQPIIRRTWSGARLDTNVWGTFLVRGRRCLPLMREG